MFKRFLRELIDISDSLGGYPYLSHSVAKLLPLGIRIYLNKRCYECGQDFDSCPCDYYLLEGYEGHEDVITCESCRFQQVWLGEEGELIHSCGNHFFDHSIGYWVGQCTWLPKLGSNNAL